MNFQIQRATMEKTDTQGTYITAKSQNTEVKQRSLKTSRGKKIGYKGQRILLPSDFNNNTKLGENRAMTLKFSRKI